MPGRLARRARVRRDSCPSGLAPLRRCASRRPTSRPHRVPPTAQHHRGVYRPLCCRQSRGRVCAGSDICGAEHAQSAARDHPAAALLARCHAQASRTIRDERHHPRRTRQARRPDRHLHARRARGAGARRRDHPRRGQAQPRAHPAPVPQGWARPGRQLPLVHGRDQRRACARAVVLPRAEQRHGGADRRASAPANRSSWCSSCCRPTCPRPR